ncbi:MAG: diphthine--ammonia ligase [Candidatus Diapherotrites archaeon]
MNSKLAVLFSGGKDSCLALSNARERASIECLISIHSANAESFMFHTPNIEWTKLQAKAMQIPLLEWKTKGEKEKELKDLKEAIARAKKQFKIDGVVTGALASNYQASRVQAICDELELKCVNPLWQQNQLQVLRELQQAHIRAKVVGVFAQGMENFLGRDIDARFIADVQRVSGINPAGEGGEFESFVYDAPFFRQKIQIQKTRVEERGGGAKVLVIEKARLADK